MSGLNGPGLAIAKTIKLFIDGAFIRTESGRTFPVYIHNTKRLYANLCRASRKDLCNAVTAAVKAQPVWAGRTAYNRGQILYRMAEMTEGKKAEFQSCLIETLGYDRQWAEKVMTEAIDGLVYYSGFADKYQQLLGSENPVASSYYNFTCSEPVGVVGLIADDHFDFLSLVAQISAIICSGNSVVVLLAEEGAAVMAPLSEVLATSDLPQGVVNLLSGFQEELYPIYGSHMEIQSLCYQGGDGRVLRELKSMAAENMKRLVTKSKESLSLESLLNFVEYKTVWQPVGY